MTGNLKSNANHHFCKCNHLSFRHLSVRQVSFMTKRRSAFTLVELLVVIGIIALLISILLPSLSKARKAAAVIKCASQMHSLGLGMLIYASQNHDWILGSPNTTGAPTTYSNTYSPGINQIWDWESPMLDTLGIKIPYPSNDGSDSGQSNAQARWDRVNYELNSPMFTCPLNQVVTTLYNPSTAFPGVTLPTVVPYMSYTTGIMFMVNGVTPTQAAANSSFTTQGDQYAWPPVGYSPKITQIGVSSQKIFIAEGARYLNSFPADFNMDFSWGSSNGGNYADNGADDSYSYGMTRSGVPLNGGTTPDARALWARHGNIVPNGPGDSFRFAACFYDGHVENLGDLQGSNPIFWAPKGTTYISTELYNDVKKAFHLTPGNYTVPY
jgi:prepilin-type N-terminal cleavage/methylation domain-containing protein